MLRHMWVWPRYVRQGGGVRFWWGKVHNDRRARTSRSRSGARVKRALPDGFLIPLLFSRSSAICDVKKPNLIIRSGQVSEFAHSCHSWGSFSGYFQITATQISLEWLFFFYKKRKSGWRVCPFHPREIPRCWLKDTLATNHHRNIISKSPYWVVCVLILL